MAPVSEADRIAVAQSYIDALVSHRADVVAFTPDCTRIEVGIKTGFSGNHLRRSLARGPQFKLIAAATPPEYSIDGDEVRASTTSSPSRRWPGGGSAHASTRRSSSRPRMAASTTSGPASVRSSPVARLPGWLTHPVDSTQI